jgi:hypothetical protein
VRPLVEADVPQVAALHRRLLGSSEESGPVERYLLEILCRHPWRDPRLPSLVYEDPTGRIAGCLGVMPRPMRMEGRSIVAAVTHSFMVEPDHRSNLAAMQLLKSFLAGPQDLSLAEGNAISRRLWEAIGGATGTLYSLRWTRPLRPARYALDLCRRRGLRRWPVALLRPVCAAADFAASRLPQSPLRLETPKLSAQETDAAELCSAIGRLSAPRVLRPCYERESLEWLLGMLGAVPTRGTPRAVLLERAGTLVGSYVYYVKPGGVSEVVQIAAAPGEGAEVLDHLFDDARSRGAIAVSGQLEPSLLPAFSERFCSFHRGRDGSWVLLHSRSDRILRALQLGDAYFTRLEGEWWIAA